MRFKALFTWIVVGAASATAAAQPKQDEAGGRVSYAETKDSPKQDAPRLAGDWVQLADATPASHGNEFIVVGKDAGDFSQLRITAAKGNTVVRRVRIDFADGTRKTIKLDATIAERGRTRYTLVNLGKTKAIDRIVVSTDSGKGKYEVYGSSGTGGGGVVSSR